MVVAMFSAWCWHHVAFVSSTSLARCEMRRIGVERPALVSAAPARRHR